MFSTIARVFLFLSAAIPFVFSLAHADTVLETKNAKKQCRAITPWYQEMQQRVGADVLNQGGPGAIEVVSTNVITLIAPMFTDTKFVPVFGKSYSQLNGDEMRRASAAFAGCVSRMGTTSYVYQALRQANPQNQMGKAVLAAAADPRSPEIQMADARKAFDGEQQGQTARRAQNARNRDLRAAVATSSTRGLPHRAGKLLLETSELRLHEYRLSSHDVDEACGAEREGNYEVSVVVKDTSAVLDPSYLDRVVAGTVIPLVQSKCGHARQFAAHFFFDGVYLDRAGKDLTTATIASQPSSSETEIALVVSTMPGGSRMSAYKNYFAGALEDASSEYHTLSGLRTLASRSFMSQGRYDDRVAQNTKVANRLAEVGVKLNTIEVRELVLGEKEANDYYWKNRARLLTSGKIVRVALGYSSVMRDQCASSTPGGLTTLQYTVTRNDYVQSQTNLDFPRDFSDVIVRLVNTDRLPSLPASDEVKGDLERLVQHHGCSSALVRQVHNRITSAMRITTLIYNEEDRPSGY